MDEVHVIRHKVLVEGRSQRQVAKDFGISRVTVRKYIEEAVPIRKDTLSDKSGEVTVSVDEALHLGKVNHWLPLLKCIVRRMLKNEFPNEYLPYLEEDGTVVDRPTK